MVDLLDTFTIKIDDEFVNLLRTMFNIDVNRSCSTTLAQFTNPFEFINATLCYLFEEIRCIQNEVVSVYFHENVKKYIRICNQDPTPLYGSITYNGTDLKSVIGSVYRTFPGRGRRDYHNMVMKYNNVNGRLFSLQLR